MARQPYPLAVLPRILPNQAPSDEQVVTAVARLAAADFGVEHADLFERSGEAGAAGARYFLVTFLSARLRWNGQRIRAATGFSWDTLGRSLGTVVKSGYVIWSERAERDAVVHRALSIAVGNRNGGG